MLLERGRFEEAEAAIREALKADIDNDILYLLLGRAAFGQNQFRAAEDAIRRAIGIDPEFSPSYYALANVLAERKRYSEAHEALDQAIELDPDDADCFALRSRLLAEKNRDEEALEAIETGLELDPDHEGCRFYRSVVLGNLGRHEEAEQESMGLLGDAPDSATNHCARGWVALEAGDSRTAEQHFVEALRIWPDSEDARVGMVHAIRHRNPVLGGLLRLIIRVDKIPFGYLMLGAFALSRVSHGLIASEAPLVSGVGVAMKSICLSFFALALIIEPLFDAVMWVSKTSRHALRSHEAKAVRWFGGPLLLGLAALVVWAFGGAIWMPVLALGLLALARLIYETFQTENGWAQRWFWGFSAIGVLTVGWILCAFPLMVRPAGLAAVEQVRAIVEAETAADGDSVEELSEEAETEQLPSAEVIAAAEAMRGFYRTRSRYLGYPALALFLLAAFSDNVRDFLLRRAPD